MAEYCPPKISWRKGEKGMQSNANVPYHARLTSI